MSFVRNFFAAAVSVFCVLCAPASFAIEVENTSPAEDGINAAVLSASDGDVLKFNAGTYSFGGSPDSIQKKLSFEGAPLDSDGTPATVFEMTGNKRFLVYGSNLGVTYCGDITNIRFLNGRSDNDNGGAILAIGSFTGNITGSFFSGNSVTAANKHGGAIYVSADFAGNITGSFFSGNTARGSGGAVYIYQSGNYRGDLRNTYFLNNKSIAGDGGAVTINGYFTGKDGGFADVGGSVFLGNTANGNGGAILIEYDAKIAAMSGDAVFQGNKAKGSENAIFFAKADKDRTISFAAGPGRTLRFFDPIAGGLTNAGKNTTMKINPDDGQTGMILFDTHQSDLYFKNAEVSRGTLALHNGAIFGADANTGTFSLEPDATLRVAYEQDKRVYDISDPFKISYAVDNPAYDANKIAKINAGETKLNGKLLFVFPSGVKNGDVMLRTAGDTDITGATAEIALPGDASLETGDRVTLIQAPDGKLSGVTANDSVAARRGVTLTYGFDLLKNESELWALLSEKKTNEIPPGSPAPAPARVYPPAKSLSEGLAANVAALTGGGGLAAEKGMKSAVSPAFVTNSYTFSGTSAGKSRIATGSHVDSSAFSVLAGLAKDKMTGAGVLTLGAFAEAGWGSYETYNSFAGFADVHGSGSSNYYGGGLSFRINYNGNERGYFYNDGAIRYGRARNKFSSGLLDYAGAEARYGTSSNYYGGHVGLGYVKNLGDGGKLDAYTRLFLTRLESDRAKLSTGETVDFDDADSLRWRVGLKYFAPRGKYFRFYAGAAYEREFRGRADAWVDGYAIDSPSLAGDTAIGEIGLLYQVHGSPFSADFNVAGFTGKREGFSGRLEFNWDL